MGVIGGVFVFFLGGWVSRVELAILVGDGNFSMNKGFLGESSSFCCECLIFWSILR